MARAPRHPLRSSSSPPEAPPTGVSTTSDLDGLDIVLPGAGLPLRDGVLTWLWLGGSLSALMTAMALYASYSSGLPLVSPLTLLLAAAPWVGVLPFLFLGAVLLVAAGVVRFVDRDRN